jgi:hypothetical protein
MAELPHLRAFLGELAHLEAVDAERLPLNVLTNICRGLMRQPLLNVNLLPSRHRDSYERSIEAEGILDERYPAMTEARLVHQHLVVSGFYAAAIKRLASNADEALEAERDRLLMTNPVAAEFIDYAANGWSSTEVAVRLYEMTCGDAALEALAPLVDAMLALDPIVGRMLHDLAALSNTDE